MDKKEKKSLPEPRTYTVEQIAAMLNIGRTTAYQLVKQEEFRIVRIRIAGDDYPAEVVKSRFMKLDSSHVQYVMDCMKDNTSYVRNIKKYLLAALYNAPTTINSYYSSLVQHDMYGDGQRGRG